MLKLSADQDVAPSSLLVALSASDWIHAYEIGDCGIRYNAFIPSVAIGIPANLNEFPWHVALYRMDNSSKHEYICGGTIIDTDIVVTAAICVFDEQQQDVDKSRMIIAAGKHNSSWEHRDMHEQRFEVISKNIPPKYYGVKNKFENDIALLRLNSSIKFSSVVMPACVDWSGSYELKGGEVGTITGWGDTVKHKLAEKLQVKRMQHLDFTDCIKNISPNISPFLTGDKFCAKNYDNSSVEMGDAGGGLMFSKNQGEKETDARYFIKGILSTKERESSIAFYTSIADHLPWIISILSPNSSHHNLGLSGTDLKNAYEIGDCGIEYDKFEPSVVLGEAQNYNDFPWNAALYRMNEKSKYEFICGGTIISANAVITAAFCVYDEIKENMDTSRMAIAVGKSNSSWEHRDVHEQRYEVVSKKTPPRYRGVRGRYEDDIALLALNDSIKFSSAVTPACIDWGLSFEPYDGEVGSVIGWGDYVKRTFSEKTKVKRMQHLSFTQCHKNISQSYSSFLTSDKFCTKNYDGTKVERGDGGSGLVFIRQDNKKDVRYFVKGILESREVGGSTVLFTNISDHIPWLYTTLTAVNHEYKLGKDH